ncbi:MAG: acetyl-CoA carboxylase biotin carboxyl carrier protein [Acidobacteria bacterium]|nr:acetyl-CoA carboxylase biotin carboxyl carrier protein [Acidobacteriota bacterium]MBI3280232.1 acetyl-CoA carboxylase biotin carboxyl carrier protein [Acidobacteriota bacterium]
MNAEEIRELIRLAQESGVAELEVQRGENRVRIRLAVAPAALDFVVPPLQAQAPPLNSQPTQAAAAAKQAEVEAEANVLYVKSPIVGTYYESPAPGSPAFVKVGDQVSPGQVLCIIESMKLMNEIESEVSGVVLRKLVENGRPVEYGEALFAIRAS